MEPNWEELKPEQFEEFTYALVKAMNFSEVKRVGGIGDGGKDVVAYYPDSAVIAAATRRWVFQAKRKKHISKQEITKELANFAKGNIDTWVLITTVIPSVGLSEWLKGLSKSPFAPFYGNRSVKCILLFGGGFGIVAFVILILPTTGANHYGCHTKKTYQTQLANHF